MAATSTVVFCLSPLSASGRGLGGGVLSLTFSPLRFGEGGLGGGVLPHFLPLSASGRGSGGGVLPHFLPLSASGRGLGGGVLPHILPLSASGRGLGGGVLFRLPLSASGRGLGGGVSEQHIRRLEVAMDHARLVGGLHRAGQRPHQRCRVARRYRRAVEAVGQRASGTILHREVRQPVVLVYFKDLHNVRMLQARDDLGLALEALPLRHPGMAAGKDHLQRHQTLQADLARLVDNAHATTAERVQYLVSRNRGRRPWRRAAFFRLSALDFRFGLAPSPGEGRGARFTRCRGKKAAKQIGMAAEAPAIFLFAGTITPAAAVL